MSEKIYSLGGEELTEEQKQAARQLQKDQEEKTQQLARQQLESGRTRIRATLDQLLKTKIDPLEDRIVVWPDEVDQMTESGKLYKPEEAIKNERPNAGTVIAVGPGKKIEQSITNKLLAILADSNLEVSISNRGKLETIKYQIEHDTIPLTPGMKILYGRFAGTPVTDPETKEELLIMRPSDIFSRFKS